MKGAMMHHYGEPVAVSAAEVSRNFGHWQDRAIASPVIVTHHGRPRVVIVSSENFSTWGRVKDEAVNERDAAFETSLSMVLDHMGEGFYALDHNLRVIVINGVACTYLGQTNSQLIGQLITERVPQLQGSILLDRIKRVERTGAGLKFEGTSPVFPDRSVEVKIFPYPNGVGIIFKNTTEEKIKDLACLEAKSCLEAVSNSTNFGYVKLNIRGVATGVGDNIYSITGLKVGEIINFRFIELFPVAERHSVQKALEEVLQHGRSIVQQCRMYSKGERDVLVELSIAPIIDDVGVAGAMVLTNFAPETNRAA